MLLLLLVRTLRRSSVRGPGIRQESASTGPIKTKKTMDVGPIKGWTKQNN